MYQTASIWDHYTQILDQLVLFKTVKYSSKLPRTYKIRKVWQTVAKRNLSRDDDMWLNVVGDPDRDPGIEKKTLHKIKEVWIKCGL